MVDPAPFCIILMQKGCLRTVICPLAAGARTPANPLPCVWPSFWRWLAYPQRARRTPRLQTLEASRTTCLTTSEPLRSSECQSHTQTLFALAHHVPLMHRAVCATDATATATCDHRSSARAKRPQKDTLNMCLPFSSVEETLLSPTHKAAIEQDGSIRTRTIAVSDRTQSETRSTKPSGQRASVQGDLVQMLGGVLLVVARAPRCASRLWPSCEDHIVCLCGASLCRGSGVA
jgi:hypothetical protein